MAAGLEVGPRQRKADDPAGGGGEFGDLPVVVADPRTGRGGGGGPEDRPMVPTGLRPLPPVVAAD